MLTFPRRTRRIALVLPLLAATGCATWSQRSASVGSQDVTYAGTMRVTRADGGAVVLDRVTIGVDSVVGIDHASPHARVAIPTSEVRRLESRKLEPVRTGVLAVLAAVGAVGAIYVFGYHADCGCVATP
jgi:hypothetical protein